MPAVDAIFCNAPPNDDMYPSWSPDGRQIAFWSDREEGGYYVMSALGGGLQKVASNPHTGSFFHSPPHWSLDGSELAYVIYETGNPQFEAWLEIISTVSRQTRRTRLPGMEQGRIDLSLSPDGRYIAYLMGVQYSDTTQLAVTNLQDGNTTSLTDGRTNVRSPRWSRDGKHVYFVSNQGGTADVWRQPMLESGKPEGDPQRITTAVGISHIAFSTDGKRIAYSQGRRVANVWRVPIREDRNRRPATWAEAEQVTFDLAFIEFVDVSHDGRQLAFSSDRSGNHDIWVMPIGGSQMRQLTFNVEPDWDPDWSPDGSYIAFYSSRTGDREIWTLPAAGGQATQLTRTEGLDATPEWSPDGSLIAFRSERTGNSGIWVVSADGRDERPVTMASAYEFSPSWSPDGQFLAFATRTVDAR